MRLREPREQSHAPLGERCVKASGDGRGARGPDRVAVEIDQLGGRADVGERLEHAPLDAMQRGQASNGRRALDPGAVKAGGRGIRVAADTERRRRNVTGVEGIIGLLHLGNPGRAFAREDRDGDRRPHRCRAAETSGYRERNGGDLLSRDPDVPFPAPGSAEDPTTASGRLSLDLFTQSRLPIHVELPTAVGTPGWQFVDAEIDRYLFRNSGVRTRFPRSDAWLVRHGRVLQAAGFLPGLTLGAPLGAGAVRIQTGANRVCAAFLPSDVQRDDSDVTSPAARRSEPRRLLRHRDRRGHPGTYADAFTDADTRPHASPCRRPPSPRPTLMPCGGSPELPQCNGDCPAGEICGATLIHSVVRLRACLGAVRGRDLADVRRDLSRGRDLFDRFPYGDCRCIFSSDPCGVPFLAVAVNVRPERSAPLATPVHSNRTASVLRRSDPRQLGGVGGFPACEQECPDAGDACIALLDVSGPGCTFTDFCSCVPPGPCGRRVSVPGTCPPGLCAWLFAPSGIAATRPALPLSSPSVSSPVEDARDPVGDERGLVLALDLDGHRAGRLDRVALPLDVASMLARATRLPDFTGLTKRTLSNP